MTRLFNFVKGLGAIGVIVAIVGAIPYFGVPYSLGRIDFITDVFNDQLASESDQIEAILTGLLLAALWVGWAMIVLSLITEIVNQTRGRAAPSLPVFPGV